MGLFNEKTDTAQQFVEALHVVLTLLLAPLRMNLQIYRAIADAFVD